MNCKGLSQENCLPPCGFVNGEKRKYCRIKTRKIDKNCKGLSQENCIPPCSYINGKIRKYCKTANVKTVKTVKIVKSSTSARKKIGNFILKNRDNITSHFLTSVCSDSGVCIAFGKESEKIKTFFDNFVFHYKKNQRELSKGANGIVYEIEYERLKYKAYTIIKTAQKKTSDNLIYEYLVGMLYINKYYKKFPCFLETYNWCIKPNNPNKFYTTTDIKELVSISCVKPTEIGIQIEYLKNANTLKSMLTSSDFWEFDILPVLFQIYFPLCCLGDTFTHYDLHYNNVLLFTPVKDHYIHYHYHGDKTTSFKSRYITKIIDYGRCYFKTDKSSLDIRKEVCLDPLCNASGKCGRNLGYGFLMEPHEVRSSHINSSIPNISHDLRLLYLISGQYKKMGILKPLYRTFTNQTNVNITDVFFKSIIYGDKTGPTYGTKENKIGGFPVITNNINDALLFLLNICSTDGFIKSNNDFYNPLKKIGDLHIYKDGRNMEFIPAP